jgi:hypothetical protein
MKYTHKRNRRRIVRGGQNSPKGEKRGCSPKGQERSCCQEFAEVFLDNLFPHEPPPSRSATPRSATPRERRPRSSSFPRRRVVYTQPRPGMGTKRRRKKRKK